MAVAAPRPRTRRRHAGIPPLAGRDIDAYDIAFVRKLVHYSPAAAITGHDDALSAGLLEYWRAAMRYDPAGGASWESFAKRRVLGAIQDEARRGDHLTRPHRAAIKAGLEAEPVVLSFDEPPCEAGVSCDDTDTLLHEMVGRVSTDDDLRLTVDAAFEAVHRVHPRAAAVLRMTYEQQIPDADQGVTLGVSISRISQLRTLGRELVAEHLSMDLLEAA